jgi:nucleotide-binding universal stress UspA family protein
LYKNILLTVDLEHPKAQLKSVPIAVEMCKQHKARLHVLTVVPDFGMSIVAQYFPKGYEKEVAGNVMEKLKAFVRKKIPGDIKVKHIVGNGNVYESILNVSKTIKADLIIVQARRPELRKFLLGPNAARVVRHAECSVLVVR